MVTRTETIRWPDRLLSLGALRLVLWVAIVSWTHSGIFTDAWKLTDWMDDHQFYAWEDADRISLLRYGQIPAWNPYWCGGTVGIAAPEDPFLSPDFFLRLLFGVANGRRLAIMLLVVLGFEGTYRLCRKLDSSAVASVFAAVVFGTTDKFVGFIHDGWVHFIAFELIPWVVFCLIAGVKQWRWRLLGGFFFAWIVLAPGTYPTPFALIVVGYLTIACSLLALARREPLPKKWWRSQAIAIWLSGLTIGLVAAGLALCKLGPVFSFLSQFSRTFTVVESHTANEVFGSFWTRYGIVAIFALIGAVTADAAAGIFVGGALLSFALAMGDYGEHSPFHLMKSLPILGQLRYPDRYMVLFVFFASVGASRGISRVEDAIPGLVRRLWNLVSGWQRPGPLPFPRELGWLAVGLAAWIAYKNVRPYGEEILEGTRIRPHAMYLQEAPRSFEQPFKQHRGNRRDAHVFPAANMGSLYCASGNPLPESPLLRGDLEQEEYPEDKSLASVKRLMWSPQAIELEVEAKAPTRIFVNQNWAPQWRTNVGRVHAVEKLLAVDVPEGKNIVRLEYKDGTLVACLIVSFLTVVGLLYVVFRDAKKWIGKQRSAWKSLPLLPLQEQEQDPKEPKS